MNEELFEIINENGEVIGTAPRSRCHGDSSLRHRAVHVFIRNSLGDYLLQKRSATKDVQPGKWDTSVGGHLCPGETYEQAAVREVEEELGVLLPGEDSLRYRHDYLWQTRIETELIRTFEVLWEGPFQPDPSELDDARFWSVAEIRHTYRTGVFTPNLERELELLGLIDQGQGGA